MKIKTYKVYKFEELTKEQQELAISNNSDINIDYDWYDCDIAELTEELNKIGFEEVDVYFSGFCCQGDGASFDCKSINLDKITKYIDTTDKFNKLRHLVNFLHYYTKTSKNSNLYSHERTRYIDYTIDAGRPISKRLEKLIEELGEEIELIRLTFSRRIYSVLENQYNALTSPEAISETLIANEYDFTENGNID